MSRAFRIVDEKTLQQRLLLKRMEVLAIFVAGTASGLWLSTTHRGEAMAAAPAVALVAQADTRCGLPGGGATRLRMDCELRLSERR